MKQQLIRNIKGNMGEGETEDVDIGVDIPPKILKNVG
jgi:hypothetical protein